jgi:hypothetical protein
VNFAFSGLGLVLTLAMTAYYHYENARREKSELGMPEQVEGNAEELGKYDLARGECFPFLFFRILTR